MQLLCDDKNSLNASLTQLQTEVTDICHATDSKQMLLARLDAQTGTLLAAQHQLERQQLSNKELYVNHLKDLSERFTRNFAQDIRKLRSEMVDKHNQGLRNQIHCDPTLSDLQKEIEVLGTRIASLVPTVMGWSDIDATTTFS